MITPATSHGTTSESASTSCLSPNSGRKMSGPSAAPNTAPKRTSEMPRARRSAGYMSAAAARERSTVPDAAPTSARPRTTSAVDDQAQPNATVHVATMPVAKPPEMTGIRPNRSIARPAGSAASAAVERKIAGPSPTMLRTPVTVTSVVVPTATATCSIPPDAARPAARSRVLRRIGNRLTLPAIQPALLGRRPRRRATDGGRTEPR